MQSTHTIADGFYWVRARVFLENGQLAITDWQVMYWVGKRQEWYPCGPMVYQDSQIAEIKRIPAPGAVERKGKAA